MSDPEAKIRKRVIETMSPMGDWLVVERVEEAKRQLSAGRLSIDEITEFVGMGIADTLRHHFRKRVGISPREYRERFGGAQHGRVSESA